MLKKNTSISLLMAPQKTLLIICVFIAINLSQSFFDILDQCSKRKRGILFFAGDKFAGLDQMLKGVKYVGYITDKSMDINDYAAQFAQAQYTLAPVILDLNNSGHEFILLDCASDDVALKKLQEIKAIPIKRNRFGIILARKFFSSDQSTSDPAVYAPPPFLNKTPLGQELPELCQRSINYLTQTTTGVRAPYLDIKTLRAIKDAAL